MPVTIALESQRYPDFHLDAFGQEGNHGQIRLVKDDPKTTGKWGLFTLKPGSEDGTIALESQRFPGFYIDAFGQDGNHGQIRLVKDDPVAKAGPWGLFKLKTVNVVGVESQRFPGFHLDAFGQEGNHGQIRLVKDDPVAKAGKWGLFSLKYGGANGTVAFESTRYPGYHLDAHGQAGNHAQIRLVKDDPVRTAVVWGLFKIRKGAHDDVFAFESMRYPGYHIDAHGGEAGGHAQIRMVKDDPIQKNEKWGLFALKPSA